MKFWSRLILLAAIDFVVIWLWVWYMNPDPSVAIGIIILVPIVILVNLAFALILYFSKRKFASLFVINSVVSVVLMIYLFGKGIDRFQNNRLESWKFKLKDTSYIITRWKLQNTFDITESTHPSSSSSYLDGTYIKKGEELLLRTDSTLYIIRKQYLHGFTNGADSIKLIKIER